VHRGLDRAWESCDVFGVVAPALSIEAVRTIATGLDHPEGVSVAPDGMLSAGGEAGQVYRIDPSTGAVEQIAHLEGGFVLGLCHDASGATYLCDAGNAAVWRIAADGSADRWCESAAGSPFVCPNWLAFAADGSLYVSDSGPEDPSVAGGRIVRIPPGGGDGEVLDLPPLFFPNGLAVGPDGTLVLLESFRPRLSVLRESGLEILCELPGTVPDGVAFDAAGGYVVSCYYPYHVYRVPPGGGAAQLLLDDATGTRFPMPTNVCFHGDGLAKLAIASLGGHGLCSVEPPIAGAPLHYPVL
jgi:gluconolactonase